MANRKFLIGMLVMILVFGMALAGCDDGSNGGGTDSALNGTWISDGEDGELKLNNGNWEVIDGGTPYMKGTYTASSGSITLKTTHYSGAMLPDGDPSKWYDKAQAKALLEAAGHPITDAELNEAFGTVTGTYSISGNKLTWTMNGSTTTFTKKP